MQGKSSLQVNRDGEGSAPSGAWSPDLAETGPQILALFMCPVETSGQKNRRSK